MSILGSKERINCMQKYRKMHPNSKTLKLILTKLGHLQTTWGLYRGSKLPVSLLPLFSAHFVFQK